MPIERFAATSDGEIGAVSVRPPFGDVDLAAHASGLFDHGEANVAVRRFVEEPADGLVGGVGKDDPRRPDVNQAGTQVSLLSIRLDVRPADDSAPIPVRSVSPNGTYLTALPRLAQMTDAAGRIDRLPARPLYRKALPRALHGRLDGADNERLGRLVCASRSRRSPRPPPGSGREDGAVRRDRRPGRARRATFASLA